MWYKKFMYIHRFEYIVITHLIFMASIAVYFAPLGLWLIPLILLSLVLFMMPGDLRFASAGKRRCAVALYKISLALNVTLFLLGAYALFTIGFLGFLAWYLAGMNLAIANRVGRALKNIARHPPSSLARSTEENRALDAAAFWERATDFTYFALAVYVGFMLVGWTHALDPMNFWGKWIWPGILLLALVVGVRRLRNRALDAATQAATMHKGAVATREAFVLADTVVPAVVRHMVGKQNKEQQRQGAFIGEAPVRGQSSAFGIRPQRLRQLQGTPACETGTHWQWLGLCVWLCMTLCGYYLFTSMSFYLSALSYKSALLIIALTTALFLWLMAARIRRAPQAVASEMARKTFLERLFMLGGLFVLASLILPMPLYTLAYGAHLLTAQAGAEVHTVKRIKSRQPCVELLAEEMSFCIRNPRDYRAAVKEGKDLTFSIRRSRFGVSVDAYVPRHGEPE